MANWSGFFGDTLNSTGSYELLSARSPNRYHLARMFRKRGLRELAEVLYTVNGVVVGSSASVAPAQVTAIVESGPTSQGGVRPIATKQQVGLHLDSDIDDASAATARNTETADTTAITNMLPGGHASNRQPSNSSGTSTYPTDASGNGGGGKLFR